MDRPILGAIGCSKPSLDFATDARVAIGLESSLQWSIDAGDPGIWMAVVWCLPENRVLGRRIRGYCMPEGKSSDLCLTRRQ